MSKWANDMHPSVSICIDLHSNWQRFHFLSQRSARVWLSSAAERFSQREQSSRDDHVTFQKNLFNEVAGGPLHVPGATWYGDTFRPQVEQLTKNFIDLKGGPRDLFMFRNVKLSCHRVSSSWRSRGRRNVNLNRNPSWLEASLKREPKSSKSEKLNFVETTFSFEIERAVVTFNCSTTRKCSVDCYPFAGIVPVF